MLTLMIPGWKNTVVVNDGFYEERESNISIEFSETEHRILNQMPDWMDLPVQI